MMVKITKPDLELGTNPPTTDSPGFTTPTLVSLLTKDSLVARMGCNFLWIYRITKSLEGIPYHDFLHIYNISIDIS